MCTPTEAYTSDFMRGTPGSRSKHPTKRGHQNGLCRGLIQGWSEGSGRGRYTARVGAGCRYTACVDAGAACVTEHMVRQSDVCCDPCPPPQSIHASTPSRCVTC